MAFTLNFADTTAFTTALDDAALPNGIAALISDAGDGTPGWFYLDQASAIATETGRVYATQSGTGRWIRVGLTAADIPGEVGVEATEPDPANPNGWAVHVQTLSTPAREVWRVWDGAAWIVSHATPMVGGSEPLPVPDKDGQFAIDDFNNTLYVAIGGNWYTVAAGMI